MKHRKHNRQIALYALVVALCLCACGGLGGTAQGPAATPVATAPAAVEGQLTVQFLDVGQADCILIRQGAHAMLVDAGNNADADFVCDTLAAQGVTALDWVVGTHPHEDHIGGLDAVIAQFDVQHVLMPRVQANTSTFEDVLDAVADKGLQITTPVVGTQMALGQAQVTVLGPVRDYGDETNNWSVGLRVSYGETAFVLCGDAEAEAEADMLQTGLALSADVLKLGHHGSSTSTSDAFLAAVQPSAVVISCGAGNSYGHPHAETLQKVAGLSVYRTDTQGTVTAVSDGQRVQFTTGAGDVPPEATAPPESTGAPESTVSPEAEQTPQAQQVYVLNTRSRKFHLPTCSGAAQMAAANRAETTRARQALLDEGYTPCSICQP